MRLAIIVATMFLAATVSVGAAEPPLKTKLQGEWTKANFPNAFKVSGDKLTEFAEVKPLAPHATGRIQFAPGRDYAVATMDNGFTLWLFSAGKNAIAVEAFDPQGHIQGTGIICYRREPQP
jgi:hypothetical protein